MTTMEALKLEREVVNAQIQPITVSGVTYDWPGGYSDGPKIIYTVTNGGDVALGGIYMRVTVASPDRSKPWTIDDNPYDIDGGLEPGESREYQTTVGIVSVAWKERGLVGRDDLEVTVEVIGVEMVEESRNDHTYHGSNIVRIDESLHDLEERFAELLHRPHRPHRLSRPLGSFDGRPVRWGLG